MAVVELSPGGCGFRTGFAFRPFLVVLIWGMIVTGCTSDRPMPEVCPECSIELEPVVSIGPNEHILAPSKEVRTSGGRYAVAPVSTPGSVAIFSRDGDFVRLVGGLGEGPGELPPGILGLARWSGDSVAVPLGMRVTILALDGTRSRTMALPGMVEQLASLGAQVYAAYGPSVNTSAGSIAQITPDGRTLSAVERVDLWDEPWVLAASDSGPVTMSRRRFDLRQYSMSSGEMVTRVSADFPFLRPRQFPGGVERSGGHLRDLVVIGDTAWILGAAHTDEATLREETGPPGADHAARAPPSVAQRLRDRPRMILTLGLQTGELIRMISVPDHLLMGFADSGHVYSTDENRDGQLGLSIWRTRLVSER